MEELYSYFLLFSSFQGIILALILIFKRNNPQNIWLTFLLIIFSLYLLELFLVNNDFLRYFPYLMFSTYPSIYFIGPTLYIYSKKLIKGNIKYTEKLIILGIPICIYLLFIPYYTLSQETKINWSWYTEKESLGYIKLFLNKGFFIIYTLLFSMLTIYNFTFRNHRKKQQDIILKKYDWFQIFLYVFTFFLVLNLVYWLISSNHFDNSFFTLFIGILIHFLTYTSILQPNFYFYTEPQKKVTYKNSIIAKDEASDIAQRFLNYLEHEEPFLNDSFDLEKAANHLHVHKRFLSQVISQNLNSSFTKIIKKYRIEKSITFITQDQKRERKIVDIAFSSGFKDTSSFYRAFKEIKKLTPTQFRDQVL